MGDGKDAHSDAQQSKQEDNFNLVDADAPVTVQKDWISLRASVTLASFDNELIIMHIEVTLSFGLISHVLCVLRGGHC